MLEVVASTSSDTSINANEYELLLKVYVYD